MKAITLFITSFAFAFLFLFGIAVGALMVMPVIAGIVTPAEAYQPLLPLSPDRDEPFLDIGEPGRQPYPPFAGNEDLPAWNGNRIIIPSIGVNVPIVMSPSLRDEDVLSVLNEGAALYPNGVLPGSLGNTFISAHSTGEPWKGKYRFAFLRINELDPGNLLHVDYNGTRYTYRMASREIIIPTPDLRIESGRPMPTMTLMACWPLWSTQKRMLIHSELVNITQLTAQQTI
jgi:LPXTG-site transpeptidase (sortase) family protein